MVCSNCKSTDIVSIQGLNYCINCGQRVAAPAAGVALQPKVSVASDTSKAPVVRPKVALKSAVTGMAKKPAAVAQAASEIKIRKTPKAAPKVEKSSLIINHPTVSAPKITVKTKAKASEAVAAIPARASSKAAPLDLRTNERKKVLEARRAMLSKPGSKPTRLSDVRPKRVAPEVTVKTVSPPISVDGPKISPDLVAKTKPQTRLEQEITTPTQAAPVLSATSGEGSALVFAWKQLGKWKYLLLALIPGIIAVIPSLAWRLNLDTVQFYQFLGENPRNLLGTDLLPNAIRYGAVWVGALTIVYWVHVVIASAITYASSKPGSTKVSTWLKVGLNSLGGILRIDTALVLPWLALIGAEYLLLTTIVYTNMPQWQQLLILVPAHMLVIYLALGLVFTRLLGSYSVVLGGNSTRAALALGWQLYRKRTLALAVCGVVGGLVAGLIYLPALALNYANRDLPAEISGMGQILGAAGFTAVLSSLALVFLTTYFYKHYRRSVLAIMDHTSDRLLSRRKPKIASPAVTIGLMVAATAAVGLATLGFTNPQLALPAVEEIIRFIAPR